MTINPFDSFIKLVRIGIGTSKDVIIPDGFDWASLKALADAQGLSAVVLDAIDKLPTDATETMPQMMRLEWIGEVMKKEGLGEAQQKAAISLGKLFHNNYIRTYVLKGFVVAECYPNPKHRECSDMDCFLLPIKGNFDAWGLGNSLVRSNEYKVSEGFYKNSTFYLPGLVVENHRFMTPLRGSKNLRRLETVLQSMIREDIGEDRFKETWLYRPPVMVTALFLIEHAYSHFLHEGLTWRMILDWILFKNKHQEDICWTDFEAFVDEFGFRKFYDSYLRLGHYLLGEVSEKELRKADKLMLDDVWAPLDLHESLHGVKAKFQLAGNYWRARWKYKYFTDITWVRALLEWVFGAVLDRHPKLA